MPSLFDGISPLDTVEEMYARIENNCNARPRTSSKELWSLRRRANIDPGNTDKEILLERSVALLANAGHMPGWYNQCPVASGIAGSHSDRRSAVDLVHWSSATRIARLVELKWHGNGPFAAIHQILNYGVAFLLCRVHKRDLPLQDRCLMDAQHIALEVVAPFGFFEGDHRVSRTEDLMAWLDQFRAGIVENPVALEGDQMEIEEYISETSRALNELAFSKTEGALTMSLNAFAFPQNFDRLPFNNGEDVQGSCSTRDLTAEAQIVRDAFEGLIQVRSDM